MENRAQRRRRERDELKTITMTRKEMHERIAKEVRDRQAEAVAKVLVELVLIPVSVLQDHYSDLMRKEVDGKSREERFADMLLDRIGCYEEDYVSLQDLDDELYRKTGLRVEDIKQRKGRGRR